MTHSVVIGSAGLERYDSVRCRAAVSSTQHLTHATMPQTRPWDHNYKSMGWHYNVCVCVSCPCPVRVNQFTISWIFVISICCERAGSGLLVGLLLTSVRPGTHWQLPSTVHRTEPRAEAAVPYVLLLRRASWCCPADRRAGADGDAARAERGAPPESRVPCASRSLNNASLMHTVEARTEPNGQRKSGAVGTGRDGKYMSRNRNGKLGIRHARLVVQCQSIYLGRARGGGQAGYPRSEHVRR